MSPLDNPTSPAPWTCKEPGSFAWRTWSVRWPAILDDTIARNTSRLDDAALDALRALRHEVAHEPLRPLDVDDHHWREAAARHAGAPWSDAPWYFAESYLYRRVLAATRFFDAGAAGHGVDPFLPVKLDEERAMLPKLAAARATLGDDVRAWLHASLWGNRADLSYTAGRAFGDSGDADDLLIDDTELALARIEAARRIDVVLDNAGTELAFDLLLVDALQKRGHAVVVHAKAQPFFVSDATPVDVARTTALLGLPAAAAPAVRAHPYWTSSGFFFASDMPRDLVKELAASDLVIFKGDANYRRLVGDAPWPHDTPATTAMDFPRPLIALRTCKAEVAVGLTHDVVAKAKARDAAWLVNGRSGMIQCA